MVLVKMYLHQDLICCPQPPSLVQLPPHLTSRNRGQNRMNITVTQELPSSTVSGTYILCQSCSILFFTLTDFCLYTNVLRVQIL